VLATSITDSIGSLLSRAEQILVITHIFPDGDALGSLTATGQALQQLNKSFSLVVDNGTPSRFAYLPLAEKIRVAPDPDSDYDLIIALDAGDVERLGQAYTNLDQPLPPIINIDHHITNTEYGQVNLVLSEANATVEILYHLFPELNVTITPDIAVSLLTGLLTDTLGLRTAGVGADTLRVAGALVDAGADLFSIFTRALMQKPLSTLLIWQKGLNNMKLEGGVIWTTISKAERHEAGQSSTGSSGLGNMMADVDQAAMSAVLTETDDGYVTVSFRCRPPYSVSDLAKDFGGGGHHLAAGCTVAGSLDEIESLIVTRSIDSMKEQRVRLARINRSNNGN
jgi:phosphoesterase RecJ-like protein